MTLALIKQSFRSHVIGLILLCTLIVIIEDLGIFSLQVYPSLAIVLYMDSKGTVSAVCLSLDGVVHTEGGEVVCLKRLLIFFSGCDKIHPLGLPRPTLCRSHWDTPHTAPSSNIWWFHFIAPTSALFSSTEFLLLVKGFMLTSSFSSLVT